MAPLEKREILHAIRQGSSYDGPLTSYPVMREAQALAVLNETAIILARPAKNVALSIEKLIVQPLATVALVTRLLSGNQVAQIAITGGGTIENFGRLDDYSVSGALANQGAARSTLTFGTIAAAFPTGPYLYRELLYSNFYGREIILPDPIVLWGDDAGGIPALAVLGMSGNISVIADFVGREWPLDPDNY